MLTYKCKDGSETRAATASMGLLHWYMRHVPQKPLPDPCPILEVIPVSKPMPGPYDPKFLVLATSVIERTYGSSPEIPSEFLEEDWYNTLPSSRMTHESVVQAQSLGHPKVVAYEAFCLSVLKWLGEYGDVISLEEP